MRRMVMVHYYTDYYNCYSVRMAEYLLMWLWLVLFWKMRLLLLLLLWMMLVPSISTFFVLVVVVVVAVMMMMMIVVVVGRDWCYMAWESM